MEEKKESLYDKVKALKRYEQELGKKTFWTLVRGYTGVNYRSRVETIAPDDINWILEPIKAYAEMIINRKK